MAFDILKNHITHVLSTSENTSKIQVLLIATLETQRFRNLGKECPRDPLKNTVFSFFLKASVSSNQIHII